MAPEVYRSKTYTLNSDIWALAVTMFKIITKKKPYKLDEYERPPQTTEWKKFAKLTFLDNYRRVNNETQQRRHSV